MEKMEILLKINKTYLKRGEIVKNKDYIEKILEIGTFLAFSALLLNVTLQVATRFFLPALSPVWTEELSRFLFIYAVVFAAPLAMKKKEYVNVDILLNSLSKSGRNILEILIEIISIALFILLFIKGIEFARLGIGQTSATLGISMTIAYSSIAITAFFIFIYGIYNLVCHIRGITDRGEIS